MRRSRRRMSLWWQQYPSNRTRRPVAAVSAMGQQETSRRLLSCKDYAVPTASPTMYYECTDIEIVRELPAGRAEVLIFSSSVGAVGRYKSFIPSTLAHN